MPIVRYPTKKSMKETLVGKHFSEMRYSETSMFGEEVKPNTTVCVSNRPQITGIMVTKVNKKGEIVRKRATEFFASVTINGEGIITKIS